MSLKKWICTISNFSDFIWFHLMCQMLAKFLGLSKGPLSTSQFLILKLPFPVTLFTSFTSIVFRDRGIVMSQSLLFSQPITNSLANRCRSPSNSATKPQNLKIIIISNRVLYFSLFIYFVRCSSHCLHQAVEWPGNSSSSTDITGCTTELT